MDFWGAIYYRGSRGIKGQQEVPGGIIDPMSIMEVFNAIFDFSCNSIRGVIWEG